MDRETNVKHSVMEHMLFDASAGPTDLSLSPLKYIANDFSDDQPTRRGWDSTVYKMLLGNGSVAVKELNETLGILKNKFNEEVGCLMKTKQKNNVRLLRYCLDKYTTGASCYEIIEGICEGLDCLHVKRGIVHLDVKPANILLDDNMEPKIADFGLTT